MADSHLSKKYKPRQPVKIGERFGKLLVIAQAGFRRTENCSQRLLLTRCDCGEEKVVLGRSLRAGVTKSCGCGIREAAIASNIGERSVTHGDARVKDTAPEYRIYRAMLNRCRLPSQDRYPQYGGRGIAVCDRWSGKGGYENFLADMGRRPDGYSIERQDRDGNYGPSNCIWAPEKVQARNRSTNRFIEFGGETLTLVEWGERIGVKPITIHQRIKAGWTLEQALTKPTFGKGVRRQGSAPHFA